MSAAESETKAQRVERLKRELNPWAAYSEIVRFAREGVEAHRGLSSSFAVVTGHEDPAKDHADVDRGRLATVVDTLVVLMGAASLPRIAAELVGHGRSPGTPVALIRWGTTEAQELWVGTLGAVATHARAARVAPPMLAIIGEVVRLGGRLAWFDARAQPGRPAGAHPMSRPWPGPGRGGERDVAGRPCRPGARSSAPRAVAARQKLTRRPGGA